MVVLYVLLFVLCLSILIMIHELGHFTAAKIFKVYVQEFSIGFGPALIHKKRKKGETYFSLRIIPFGGYVSMYGEDSELEGGVVVDKKRSLEGIKRWKRLIIMAAGVIMNAVLALLIFFVYNVSFSNSTIYLGYAQVKEDSIAYNAGLRTLDAIAFDEDLDSNQNDYTSSLHLLDNSAVVTLENGDILPVMCYMDQSQVSSFKKLNLIDFMRIYEIKYTSEESRGLLFEKDKEKVLPIAYYTEQISIDVKIDDATSFDITFASDLSDAHYDTIRVDKNLSSNNGIYISSLKDGYSRIRFVFNELKASTYPTPEMVRKATIVPYSDSLVDVTLMNYSDVNPSFQADFTNEIHVDSTFKNVTFTINSWAFNLDQRPYKKVPHNMTVARSSEGKGLEDFGYSFYLHTVPPLPFFKAIGQSFVDFGHTSTLIVRALITLFQPSTFKSVGGIVAMGFETTSVLKNFGFSKYLYIWGALSVNLAIVNLLPFPGLDGWQILVLIVEGITRKKMPDKAKRIVSFIGIGLLFTLMAVLVIKDIFTYIF